MSSEKTLKPGYATEDAAKQMARARANETGKPRAVFVDTGGRFYIMAWATYMAASSTLVTVIHPD